MCPKCHRDIIIKKGSYTRKSDQKKIQRFFCKVCNYRFSDQCFRIDYWQKKRSINQKVFRLLCKGVSQRGCAMILDVKPAAIALRVKRFGKAAEKNLENYRKSREKCENILVDEMETFEHTKCKPLTIPIAVEEKTRKILALKVGRIAAKGHLAAFSRKKYGYRKCDRKSVLNTVFSQLEYCCDEEVSIKSDESQHYPRVVKKVFPLGSHIRYKSRRGCVVGQGELKRGGFDPLFFLNHTYAMIRDNLKRLARRTWCTTKRIDRLENLLNLYAWFHNMRLDGVKRPRISMYLSPI